MGQEFESLQARQVSLSALIGTHDILVLAESDKFNMAGVAQLVRAPDCGSGGQGFDSLHSPHKITVH